MNDPQPFDEIILAAALEFSGPERDAFLAQFCAGDVPLHARLAVLLRLRSEPPPCAAA